MVQRPLEDWQHSTAQESRTIFSGLPHVAACLLAAATLQLQPMLQPTWVLETAP
jgi:hypothetical protein